MFKLFRSKMAENLFDMEIRVKILTDEKERLTEELELLKMRKRIEQEELKHMIKITEEKNELRLKEKELMLEKEKQEVITRLKEENKDILTEALEKHHGKLESRFAEELSSLKEVYALLMERLPNVNLDISRHYGDPKIKQVEK